MKDRTQHWMGALLGAALLAAGQAQAAATVQVLWDAPLAESLRARIYQTVIVPGATPRVIATTPEEVVAIEQGKAGTLFRLEHGGALGKSALLPDSLTGDAARGLVGVLSHNHHAVESFELRDLGGRSLAKLDDARHVFFRLSPDGKSVVGVDPGNTHTALTAAQVTYRFFDRAGNSDKQREVVSPRPPLSHDSAFSPDGGLFFINSQDSGLTAYDPATAAARWMIGRPVKMFAAADQATGMVLITDAKARNNVALYQQGKPVWESGLAAFGDEGNVRNIALSPNGEYAVATGHGTLFSFSPRSGKPTGVFKLSSGAAINSVAVSDLGVIAVGAQAVDLKSGELWFLDAATAQPLAPMQRTEHARSNAWIPMVQFDAGGRYVLVRTLERISLYGVQAARQSK